MPHQAPADRLLPLRPLATRRDTARTRQQRVLELALQGQDPSAIAAALRVSRRTVERHLAASRTALQDLRHRRLQQLTDHLAAGAGAAVTVLAQIAQDPVAPPQARVAAARALLAEARAYTELTDLAARVAAIEERLTAVPAGPTSPEDATGPAPAAPQPLCLTLPPCPCRADGDDAARGTERSGGA
jgi:hypothetical protein